MKTTGAMRFAQSAAHTILTLVPKRTAANMITAIVSWLFSDYAVSVENVYRCDNCGYESPTLPEPLQNDTGHF